MSAALPIYQTPGGYAVREFSHAQYNEYSGCPKQYYFKRLLGWVDRYRGAAMEFGNDLQEALRMHYQAEADPIEAFSGLWEVRRDAELEYPAGETWARMREDGVGLMARFLELHDTFPVRKPVFFNFRDRNRPRVRDSQTGAEFCSIPDLLDTDDRGPFLADIKSFDKLLDTKTPGIVALDMQLRTQAAVMKVYRVALWNFCRSPKRSEVSIERARAVAEDFPEAWRMAAQLKAVNKACGLVLAEAGKMLGIPNPEKLNREFNAAVKENETLGELLDKHLEPLLRPEYVIQWLEAEITPEHAEEALRIEMSLIPLVQQGWFPRRGGIRFPDSRCTWCPHRGLCLEELLGPRAEYEQITQEELKRWDEDALEGLE